MREVIKIVRSRTVVLASANIDTDQIIPARFLNKSTPDGWADHLFADWRYDADGGQRPEFALNRPETQGCEILVTGRNFGCGSSREHAPWALRDYGFRAVVSTQIADIFRSNALKNGLLPVLVDDETCNWLIEHPGADVSIDVTAMTLALPTGDSVMFPLEPFAQYCLLNGVDELEFLLGKQKDILRYEERSLRRNAREQRS